MEDTVDCCVVNSVPQTSNDYEMRPTTPPNSITISTEVTSTPVAKHESSEYETNFLRKINLNRLRSTSTPIHMNTPRFSSTLPNPRTTSSLAGFNDHRQCLSADCNCTVPKDPDKLLNEYINPFTPDGRLAINKRKAHQSLKRLNINPVRRFSLFDSDSTECGEENSINDSDITVRHRLNEMTVSRFNEEFIVLDEVGKGSHGCVLKCMNRINGCIYAVKRTIKPIKSSIDERDIRNEIYAHGILDHRNIVRNYSCWYENGIVFIQNEFCNGGNLERYYKSKLVTETLLQSLLLQMGHALRYIHKKGLAHMDVKPSNILLCLDKSTNDGSFESDGGFSDDDKCDEIIFKLADLGHVTKLDEDEDVEEGDCRYMPREILEEKFNYLDRADIFSLGLSVYEAAGGGPLPKNGEEWHNIRDGKLLYLNNYTKEFNDILKEMVQPTPENRPSSEQLIKLLEPNYSFSSEDVLHRYRQNNFEPNCSFSSEDVLHRYRQNNSVLEHRVQATGQYLKYLAKSHKELQELLHLTEKNGGSAKEKLSTNFKKKGFVTKNRVVGKKTKRSSSTTLF